MFDSGLQENLISKHIVNQLGLETQNHPRPYPLGWINKSTHIHVTRQCRLKFSITSKYIDEVELDVVPIDICGVVLGSPYLYDRDAFFYRREHKYHLKKEGVEFIVRAHKVKSNLDLIVSNQVKQFISSSKYVLMVVKEQHQVDCSNCEIQFIDQLVKVVNYFPRSLIHEQDKQHEIHLMSYEHLLKDRMNLNSFIQLNCKEWYM